MQYDDANTLIAITGQSAGEGFLERSVSERAAIPEPASWALMISGYGLAGAALRRRSSLLSA